MADQYPLDACWGGWFFTTTQTNLNGRIDCEGRLGDGTRETLHYVVKQTIMDYTSTKQVIINQHCSTSQGGPQLSELITKKCAKCARPYHRSCTTIPDNKYRCPKKNNNTGQPR